MLLTGVNLTKLLEIAFISEKSFTLLKTKFTAVICELLWKSLLIQFIS